MAFAFVAGISLGLNNCACPEPTSTSPASIAELEARTMAAEAEWERLRQVVSLNCESLDSLTDEELKRKIRTSGPGLF